MSAQDATSRESIAARLESLVRDDNNNDETSMLRASTSKLSSAAVAQRPRTPRLQSLTSTSMHIEPAPPKEPLSVKRWNGLDKDQSTNEVDMSSLEEALNESLDLPSQPPLARLPPSYQVSRSLSRPPPFIDSLTRSTLPLSSLSPRASFRSQDDLSPRYMQATASRRTSEATLKRVQERSMSTAATDSPRSAEPSKSNNWWWFSENKEHVDSLLDDADRGDSVASEQKKIQRKYRSPKHPMVFCHGLLGFDSVSIGPSIAPMQVTHWRGIKEVLEANGTEVLITRVPATSSPPDRARVLEEAVSKAFPGRKVHLIGHSMGGLDCRFLTTHLNHRKFEVLSVTTIATPHRGSSFASTFLETVGKSNLPSVLSWIDMLPNGGGDGKAFESLTLESMLEFNKKTPNVDGVQYFSWGAEYDPGLIDTWKWPHSVILDKEGPNDGLVSVHSAKWGKYLGTLTHVNHLDLVGWINPARYKWAEFVGNKIKFRPATFYLGVGDYLAGEVDGVEKEITEDDDDHGQVGDGVKMRSDGDAANKRTDTTLQAVTAEEIDAAPAILIPEEDPIVIGIA